MKWIDRRINRVHGACGAVLVGITAAAVGLAGPGLAGASSGASAGSATSSVIVVLRDQLVATPDSRQHAKARSDSAADIQAPLVRAVRASGGTVTDQFHLLNAFAADVDSSELAALRADPAVAQVVPNQTLAPATGSSPLTSWAQAAANGAQDAPSSPSTATVAPQTRTAQTTSPRSVPLVTGSTICGTAADPLLEPEALQLTHTAPLTANGSTAGTERSTGIDGTGVTVAEISNIVDPTNADLIRQSSGTPAVTNVDMTGDGDGSGGAEGWGDVSAIVAQGNQTYDLSTQSGFSNPEVGSGCDIKIEGVAPGAGVYAIGVTDTDASYLSAIDYAVSTLHVNVLNESFGSNYIPSGDLDMFQVADNQAYAAGVTVVVASGDAGPTSTIEDPANDPDVISVGASTAFRAASQGALSGAGLTFLNTGVQGGIGWVDNSPAALSSSGPDQQDGTVDLLAPGDSGWSVCSAATSGGECSGPIDDFGGTSQSAPLVAGAAALVIQAYKQNHAGRCPDRRSSSRS